MRKSNRRHSGVEAHIRSVLLLQSLIHPLVFPRFRPLGLKPDAKWTSGTQAENSRDKTRSGHRQRWKQEVQERSKRYKNKARFQELIFSLWLIAKLLCHQMLFFLQTWAWGLHKALQVPPSSLTEDGRAPQLPNHTRITWEYKLPRSSWVLHTVSRVKIYRSG